MVVGKSLGYHLTQTIIVLITFIFQILLLIQLKSTQNNINDSGIVSFLLTNACIVCGYLLDLIGGLDNNFYTPQNLLFIKITILFESVSIVFDLSSVFGISLFNTDNKYLQYIIPIISIVGIGIYNCLVAYFLILSLFKENVKD